MKRPRSRCGQFAVAILLFFSLREFGPLWTINRLHSYCGKPRSFSKSTGPLLETDTVPCRREMRWNLRSFKAPKVPRLPTSRKRVTEKKVRHGAAGRSTLQPAIFILPGNGGSGSEDVRIREANQAPSAASSACNLPQGQWSFQLSAFISTSHMRTSGGAREPRLVR